MMSVTTAKRVFILGAGASRFAGYPLAIDLMAFLKAEAILESRTQQIATEVFYKLHHAELQLQRVTRKSWDLETLLTHLDIYKTVGKLRIFTGDWCDVDRMKMSRVIADRFQWHQYKLNSRVWREKESSLPIDVDQQRVKKISDAWSNFLRAGDIIISFNWDLLHETILWNANKWCYVDGYGFRVPRATEEAGRSIIKILKLHGSVNWVQEEETDWVTEIEFARDFFVGSNPPPREFPPHTTGMDSGRKLILPTYLKDISRNRALLSIWRMAQESLRAASEIWVIGYSLNPADHPARLLLGTELGRNEAIETVHLISPSVGGWLEFLARIDKRVHHIPKPFEQWVLSESV
ncbi:MAG: hypothetical protein HY234_14770 [Acidobacteria bacterium]|nr:hypothetical protein [Acidobacteriota bacterium]MBI3664296.1 hypothetical protein [Acidobacteriota bacterium]